MKSIGKEKKKKEKTRGEAKTATSARPLITNVIISIVPLFMFVGKNFLPVDDQSQFEISVRAPEGYTLAATGEIVERIAADLRNKEKFPGVIDTLITIGGGQQQQVNSASIYVKLVPIEERRQTRSYTALARSPRYP